MRRTIAWFWMPQCLGRSTLDSQYRHHLQTIMCQGSQTVAWPDGWREAGLHRLAAPWDLIVIGGGISGAGILAVAARMGLRVLLVERGDFASGTSSCSSKLIHGGLRYLRHLQLRLTAESVREREYLLKSYDGLVERTPFLYPVYDTDSIPSWLVALCLKVYTHLARDTGGYQRLTAKECTEAFPGLADGHLRAGFQYSDAHTDDARLVLRVLSDGLLSARNRSVAMNYCSAVEYVRRNGRVIGIACADRETGQTFEALGRLVINATGVWVKGLQAESTKNVRIRPLRGSHLFFLHGRLPVSQALAISHPTDHRPVFAYPWEGVTLVGTTDVDHQTPLSDEPTSSREEINYLLDAVQSAFPHAGITRNDIISTQAGLRPILHTGKAKPSSESRDYVMFAEPGLLTVTGGKLTTFRPMAVAAMRAAHSIDSNFPKPNDTSIVIGAQPGNGKPELLAPSTTARLIGRYGAAASALCSTSDFVPGTPYMWSEIEWSARSEAIVHLEDILLRRFRLGIILADGGVSLLDRLKPLIRNSLRWSDDRWSQEAASYIGLHKRTRRFLDG